MVRALALMTGEPYRQLYNELTCAAYTHARLHGKAWDFRGIEKKGLYKEVFHPVYRSFGLVRVKLPSGPRPTFKEATAQYGRCIIETKNHAVYADRTGVYDTWDSRRVHGTGGGAGYTDRKALRIWIPGPDMATVMGGVR